MHGSPFSWAISCALNCFLTYTGLSTSNINMCETNRERVVCAAFDCRVIYQDHALPARNATDASNKTCARHGPAVHVVCGQSAELQERRAWVQQRSEPGDIRRELLVLLPPRLRAPFSWQHLAARLHALLRLNPSSVARDADVCCQLGLERAHHARLLAELGRRWRHEIGQHVGVECASTESLLQHWPPRAGEEVCPTSEHDGRSSDTACGVQVITLPRDHHRPAQLSVGVRRRCGRRACNQTTRFLAQTLVPASSSCAHNSIDYSSALRDAVSYILRTTAYSISSWDRDLRLRGQADGVPDVSGGKIWYCRVRGNAVV